MKCLCSRKIKLSTKGYSSSNSPLSYINMFPSLLDVDPSHLSLAATPSLSFPLKQTVRGLSRLTFPDLLSSDSLWSPVQSGFTLTIQTYSNCSVQVTNGLHVAKSNGHFSVLKCPISIWYS